MAFGTALAGYGTALPQINQMQADQDKKRQMASLFQALHKSQGAGAPAAGMPGAPPAALPGATPMPGSLPATTPGGPAVPNPNPTQALPPTAGGPLPVSPTQSAGGGFAGGLPNLDKMIELIFSGPGSDTDKMAMLEHYGAFASPYEKMQAQLEMKQATLSNQASMLDQKLQEMRDLALIRDNTTRRGQDKKEGTADVGRDVGSIEKELSNQRALLQGMLNQPGIKVTSPEYVAEKTKYDTLAKELEGARAGNKGNMRNARGGTDPLTKDELNTEQQGGAAPDASKLSDKEERSLDGGKTWWVLQDGKPVQAGN